MTPDPGATLAPGKLPARLLARLLADHPSADDPTVLVPPAPGHDAAVIRAPAHLVVKTDPITFATAAPAAHLVAVNANDLACLGGIPRWMTVTALFPPGTTESDVARLFGEVTDAARRSGVTVIGGHCEVTPGIDRLILSATLLGPPGDSGLVTPGKARAGDVLLMTRHAGIEGTAILASELAHAVDHRLSDETLTSARNLIDDPGIAIAGDAAIALGAGGVTALHDPTEGGIATAVHEIADASGLGAVVDLDTVPVLDATRRLCAAMDLSPYGLIASGALLIAAAPAAIDGILAAYRAAGVPVTVIGTLTSDIEERRATLEGAEGELPRYDADEIARAFARFA